MGSKLSKLLRCVPCRFSFAFGAAWFFAAFAYFFHYDLAVGNLWKPYALLEIFSAALNAVLFWAYLSMATYRFTAFGSHSKRHGWIAALGAFFSALVAGCPACAPTLASALGLFSVVSVFPGGGLGLKIVGASLLAYSVTRTYQGLEECALPKRKSAKRRSG